MQKNNFLVILGWVKFFCRKSKNRDKIAKITDIGPQGGGHFFGPKCSLTNLLLITKKKKYDFLIF